MGVLGLVVTDAVLSAALGSSTLTKEAYINSMLTQPYAVGDRNDGAPRLLKPLSVSEFTVDKADGQLEFVAELLRDVAGTRAGSLVSVKLDLINAEELTLT
jgi:hypothetical protein